MGSPTGIRDIETALRSLIAGEAFDEARPLLDDFGAAVESEVRGASADPVRLLEVRARFNEFLAWAEARTKAQRACAESESVRLRSLGCYDPDLVLPASSASA